MDTSTLKQKIADGLISDEELSKLLDNRSAPPHFKKRNYLKNILDGFIEGYTTPNLWRSGLDAVLLLSIITGIVILCYAGKLEPDISMIFLASILGFLFGKMKK